MAKSLKLESHYEHGHRSACGPQMKREEDGERLEALHRCPRDGQLVQWPRGTSGPLKFVLPPWVKTEVLV